MLNTEKKILMLNNQIKQSNHFELFRLFKLFKQIRLKQCKPIHEKQKLEVYTTSANIDIKKPIYEIQLNNGTLDRSNFLQHILDRYAKLSKHKNAAIYKIQYNFKTLFLNNKMKNFKQQNEQQKEQQNVCTSRNKNK